MNYCLDNNDFIIDWSAIIKGIYENGILEEI